MSQLPPLQPATPADEWASSTVGALDDRTKETTAPGVVPGVVPGSTHTTLSTTTPAPTYDPTTTSQDRYKEAGATAVPATAAPASTIAPEPVETPGPSIPGAFPRTLSEVGSTQAAQQAQAALQVAQEKLTQAVSGAAHYLPQSVKEQVAPYLRQ
jgi:hypothetical protein